MAPFEDLTLAQLSSAQVTSPCVGAAGGGGNGDDDADDAPPKVETLRPRPRRASCSATFFFQGSRLKAHTYLGRYLVRHVAGVAN